MRISGRRRTPEPNAGKIIVIPPRLPSEAAWARVAELRKRRDEDGWPEPRTIDDLRLDPRVGLRNRVEPGYPGPDDLLLAAALMLLVADDLADAKLADAGRELSSREAYMRGYELGRKHGARGA